MHTSFVYFVRILYVYTYCFVSVHAHTKYAQQKGLCVVRVHCGGTFTYLVVVLLKFQSRALAPKRLWLLFIFLFGYFVVSQCWFVNNPLYIYIYFIYPHHTTININSLHNIQCTQYVFVAHMTTHTPIIHPHKKDLYSRDRLQCNVVYIPYIYI